MDAVPAAGPFADREGVARGAAGLVDQRRGGGPTGVIESRLVQRREDALEGIVRVHGASFFRVSARARPQGMRSRSQVGTPPLGSSWILQWRPLETLIQPSKPPPARSDCALPFPR